MIANHPFAATLEQVRKGGFASLNEQQKREWHADVYAFRRWVLSVPREQRTSPPDPQGVWFNPDMIAIAERYYEARQDDRNRIRASQRAARLALLRDVDPPAPAATRPATMLGVTAREFDPSAERLAAARRELGIEPKNEENAA